MARMTGEQLETFLSSGDHRGTAILAVEQPGKGPLVVPLTFQFENGSFYFSTKPSRRHAEAFEAAGRASVIVHHEDYGSGRQVERYVAAEGPIAFAAARPADDEFGIAVLVPDSLVGVVYDFTD